MAAATQSPGRRRIARMVISYAILVATAACVVLPFAWLVISSLKAEHEYHDPPDRLFADGVQWSNYAQVFDPYFRILRHAGISLFLALSTSGLTIISSSLAGFAFSRFPDVPGRDKLFSIILALLLVPGTVIIIPQFVVYDRLNLLDTYWPWIMSAVAGSPTFIFFFRQVFVSFPRELEDAAEVDGCSRFRIYWQVFLPNARPALAAVLSSTLARCGESGTGRWYSSAVSRRPRWWPG